MQAKTTVPRLLCPLLTFTITATAVGAESAPPEYLVGVYYFAGWWRETPNKWLTHGKDWRPDWPGRVPTLGEYNEQETMDREIAAAADHGVDFFQILYYCLPPGGPPEPHAERLNDGLRRFLASKNADRLKFTIEFVNHPPFDVISDDEWQRACREWAAAMKHPSQLRIDGRPVFKIHGWEHFVKSAGSPQNVKAKLDVLRRAVREAGAGDVMLSAGILPQQLPEDESLKQVDFLTTYMWMPMPPKRDEPYPYEDLIRYAEEGWRHQAERGRKPYVPYVPAGWDPRPWKDPRPSFAMPDRGQWLDALKRVKATLDKHPRLGVPRADGGRQKMVLIYAWNEFGEGGIVAPTKGEGTMKLEGIKEVFGQEVTSDE